MVSGVGLWIIFNMVKKWHLVDQFVCFCCFDVGMMCCQLQVIILPIVVTCMLCDLL